MQAIRPVTCDYAHPQLLLGGLVQEGIFVQPVGDVAVKGARLHGHTVHGSECLVCDIERLEHPEAWRGRTTRETF